MIKYEDECVGCHREMGCLGRECPYSNIPHVYCDECKDETEKFYYYDGEWLCKDCYISVMLEEAETATAEDLIERNSG